MTGFETSLDSTGSINALEIIVAVACRGGRVLRVSFRIEKGHVEPEDGGQKDRRIKLGMPSL
jgi:hypothetical protein